MNSVNFLKSSLFSPRWQLLSDLSLSLTLYWSRNLVLFSLLCPAEEGSDAEALVGTWHPSRVKMPQEKKKGKIQTSTDSVLSYQSDCCHVMLTLVTAENASEAQELLAQKTCLWLNQWIAPRLSLLCLCMCCCLSFWSLIILIGLNFSVRIDAAYQISSIHHERTDILLWQT